MSTPKTDHAEPLNRLDGLLPTGPDTRRGRGRAQATVSMIDAAAEILSEIQPASVRAVCYRLFVAGVIDSMSKSNTQKVSRNLVTAREEGVIPWRWIVDETREAETVSTWSDPEEIIGAAVTGYRKNYWRDQPERVEVWSEKGTIRGTLAPVLNNYGVTLRVMHGFTSATTINDIAASTVDDDRPLTVLYVGDWDPSGMHMSEIDLPARLHRYGGNAEIVRLALTIGDVENVELPGFNAITKTADPRHKWFVENYGRRCIELDALPPPQLRARVESGIAELINGDAWDHARIVEHAEIESMRSLMESWNRSISVQVAKYSEGAP